MHSWRPCCCVCCVCSCGRWWWRHCLDRHRRKWGGRHQQQPGWWWRLRRCRWCCHRCWGSLWWWRGRPHRLWHPSRLSGRMQGDMGRWPQLPLQCSRCEQPCTVTITAAPRGDAITAPAAPNHPGAAPYPGPVADYPRRPFQWHRLPGACVYRIQ
jgi:hypothetical protein